MLGQQRQKLILDFLRTHKSAQVHQLSSVLGISLSTVRRDLSEMDQEGLVRRVHGGAMFIENYPESPALLRASDHAEQKRRIGEAAAQLVNDGESIVVTAGTTTEAMIPYLADKANLTVVTNALNIAWKLATCPHINVVVLGGWLRHSELSLLGHLTMEALKDIHMNKIFHGTYGIDPTSSLAGTYMQEVETDRLLIATARELIVLADSSKFGQPGTVRLVPIEAVSTIITDTDVSPSDVATLRAKGVTVIVA